MRRVIVVFLICVGGLVSSGCGLGLYGLTQPRSEITASTPIYHVQVCSP